MNAGSDYRLAKRQAQANANRSGQSRWLHMYGLVWWISALPVVDAEQIDPDRKPEYASCGQCGALHERGQSCGCFDNGCQ